MEQEEKMRFGVGALKDIKRILPWGAVSRSVEIAREALYKIKKRKE